MAIESGDFKTGLTVLVDGDPCVVLDFMHVKPGKGAAILRTKMKNLKTGVTQERNFNANVKFEQANIEKKNVTFSYESDGVYYFMDGETYEMYELTEEQIGFNKYFREWICPEHTGYARQKFEKWWDEHKCFPIDPVPETVDEAIEMANSGILKYPVKITIRHVSGEKFDRISEYEYGDPPDTQYQQQYSKEDEEALLGVASGDDDGSDIPF